MAQAAAQRSALMSIRPPYASAILDGTKRVEFRKRKLAADIRKVIIYTTAPVMAVVGHFTVEDQVVDSPERLWERFSDVAGIDRESFFAYFNGTSEAVGIVIGDVDRYPSPRRLSDVDSGARPPQSVKYLDGSAA